MTNPFHLLDRIAPATLGTLSRLIFAAVLAPYFWSSAQTKIGDGLFGILHPTAGGYIQIFPKMMEAAGYNPANLPAYTWIVVVAGTLAEFALPFLITIGLLTRPAALAMIGFIVVQSLTDLYGHGGIAYPETLGAWFDATPDGAILDQRAFWMLLLTGLVLTGAGPLSLDRLLRRPAQRLWSRVSNLDAMRRPAQSQDV